eukprot:2489373-Amphidinium_carterae.1
MPLLHSGTCLTSCPCEQHYWTSWDRVDYTGIGDLDEAVDSALEEFQTLLTVQCAAVSKRHSVAK